MIHGMFILLIPNARSSVKKSQPSIFDLPCLGLFSKGIISDTMGGLLAADQSR